MIAEVESDNLIFHTTDGEIAAINLNSARLRSWARFDQDPQRAGVAETVLEHEQLTSCSGSCSTRSWRARCEACSGRAPDPLFTDVALWVRAMR